MHMTVVQLSKRGLLHVRATILHNLSEPAYEDGGSGGIVCTRSFGLLISSCVYTNTKNETILSHLPCYLIALGIMFQSDGKVSTVVELPKGGGLSRTLLECTCLWRGRHLIEM